MKRLRLQAIAWRLGLAQAVAPPLLPAYSLRRLRGLVWQLGGVDLPLGVHVCGGVFFANPNAEIQPGVFIGPRVQIIPTAEAPVYIGKDAAIGPGARILTVTHEIGTRLRRAGEPRSEAVSIAPGAWVGAGATILPGVNVEEGAVVAAGAVVAENVPPNTLVGGVPARRIRDLPHFSSS